MKNNEGFTLVELLLVLVIVGALAAIVLVALTDARKKGGDAGVKSNLSGSRSQAEVFYNNNTSDPNSYTNVCSNGVVGGVEGIGLSVYTAARAAGLANFVDDSASSSSQAVCNDSASAWAAEVPLLQGGFWCVDSTNASKYKATSGLTSAGDYVCG